MVTNNGKEMWRKVEQLGTNRKYNSKIPTQVVINGRISTNIEQILKKWKDDFSSLYQIKPVDTEGPNKDFLNRVKETLRKLDDGKLGQEFEFNPISEAKIIMMTKNIKNGKAVSVDKIPNEVMQNPNSIFVLEYLYHMCLEKTVIPDIWRKAIISPVFKGKGKDVMDPLSYRPVSLISNP